MVSNFFLYAVSPLFSDISTAQAGIAARKNYTDKDVIDFITNVECAFLCVSHALFPNTCSAQHTYWLKGVIYERTCYI